MAKITAHGDSAWRRWKHEDGRELCLTVKGRLLYKWQKGASWTLACKARVTLAGAEKWAADRGLRGGLMTVARPFYAGDLSDDEIVEAVPPDDVVSTHALALKLLAGRDGGSGWKGQRRLLFRRLRRLADEGRLELEELGPQEVRWRRPS